MNIGEKATETAAPFEIDLQLFADEGEAAIDTGSAGPATDVNTAGADSVDDDGDHDISIGEKQALFDGTLKPEDDPEKKLDTVPEPVKKEQSPEANAAFAELRRKAEQAERKLADEQNRRDKFYADRFGERGINTEAQYMKALEETHKQEAAARQQEIQTKPQQAAMQTYNQLIAEGYDDSHARREANKEGALVAQSLQLESQKAEIAAIKQKEKLREEQAGQQVQQIQTQQILKSWEEDRAKLKEEYGDLVPDNLENLDQEVAEALRGGVPFKKAWLAANIDKVVDLAKGKGAQKAMKEINSKAHLDSEKGGGSGVGKQVHVSDEKMEVWRALGYSDKEARQKEARYQRQKRV
jgi:hypothetical protein